MGAGQPSTPNGGRLGFDDPVVKQLQNLRFQPYVVRQLEFEPDR